MCVCVLVCTTWNAAAAEHSEKEINVCMCVRVCGVLLSDSIYYSPIYGVIAAKNLSPANARPVREPE